MTVLASRLTNFIALNVWSILPSSLLTAWSTDGRAGTCWREGREGMERRELLASLEEKYVRGLRILGEENFNGGKQGGREIEGKIKEGGRRERSDERERLEDRRVRRRGKSKGQ